jgi:hypothetical protein
MLTSRGALSFALPVARDVAFREMHYSERMSEGATPDTRPGAEPRSGRFRAAAAVALAIVVGLILWLALRDTGGSSTSSSANALATSIDQLRALTATVGHPIFWVGPRAGYTYELTRTSNGSIYIRYLPPDAKVGTKTPYLTVATYHFPGAFAAVAKVAKQKGVTTFKLAHGGLAEVKKNAKSVHAAYPGIDYQVEIYDPAPEAAAGLAATGQLAAFGSLEAAPPAAPRVTATSPAALQSLARSLGHPIYWVGKKKGYTYELTRGAQGQVTIRYLPPRTNVGAGGAYLTVATYPFRGAFAAIRHVAKQPTAKTIVLPKGGLAVVTTNNPRDVHLAYPGSDYQIEVFDPSAGRARRIVTSGQLMTVG